MRPTLHLGLPSGVGDVRWQALSGPMQGFDAIRIVSQIISLQALHYLALSFLIPPLLGLLTFNKSALNFQGGPTSLSMVLDWREIAGYAILDGGRPWPWNRYKIKANQHDIDFLRDSNLQTSDSDKDRIGTQFWWEYEAFLHSQENKFIKISDVGEIAWEGKRLGAGSILEKAKAEHLIGKAKVNGDPDSNENEKQQALYANQGWWPIFAQDSSRGWIIVIAWALAGAVDVFLLSILIRRPTHILDHTITLHAIHLFLVWIYTRSFPTSLFYWMVMAGHIGATVVWAEALSIRREMKSGFQSGLNENSDPESSRNRNGANEEQARLLGSTDDEQTKQQHHRSSSTRSAPHVLFDDEDQDDEEDHKNSKEKYRNGGHDHEEIEMKRID